MLKRGFSLMEMMVVLLIVAIISAAAAPMVSKKLASGAGGSGVDHGCGWKGWDGNTVFNSKADDGHSVLIGIGKLESKKDTPHLFISTKSHKNPQIRLQDKNKKEHINLAFFNRSTWLSSRDVPNTTEYATAVGYEASAYNNATALGYKANASGVNSVAIGREVTAFSDSVMIGNSGVGNKDFDSINLIAIGSGARNISDSDAIMIGTASNSEKYLKAGQGAVAIGSQTTIDKTVLNGAQAGIAAVAIGTGSSATNNSVAIGRGSSTHLDENSVAIGKGSSTYFGSAVAIGNSANSVGTDGISLGSGALVEQEAQGGIAVGVNASSVGQNAIAVGLGSNASGSGSLAIGSDVFYGAGKSVKDMKATATYSIALGSGTQATESGAMALGAISSATGKNSIAIGGHSVYIKDNLYTSASGESAVAIGTSAIVSGNSSMAIGLNSECSADNSVAIGEIAKASGNNSVAIGYNATSSANISLAIGENATASANNSVAIGSFVTAKHESSIAIGVPARPTAGQVPTTTTASNQIVLGNKDTVVYIPGRLVVDGNVVLGRNDGSLVYVHLYNTKEKKEDSGAYLNGIYPILKEPTPNNEPDRFEISSIKSQRKMTTGEGPDDVAIGQIGLKFPDCDRRLKNVGEVFKGGLDEIKKLEVFNYTYKKDKDKTPRVGVMAQDLQKVFPNAVFKGDDGFLRIRMEDMFYALVNAVKELDRKVDMLIEKQKKIDELEKRVDALEKRLAKLEKQK